MLNESVKAKIEEASNRYDGDPYSRTESTTFINGVKFGYALASGEIKEERSQWEPQWNSNAEANAAGYNQSLDKIQLLQSENARLKEKLEISVKALEYFEGEKKITYCQTATGVHQIETYPANDFLKQIRDDKDKI